MNKKHFYTLLVVFALSFMACAKAAIGSGTEKETMVFAVKGQDTLRLDKYEKRESEAVSPRSVVLFAFGGGFKAGERDRKDYIPFFEFLTENGYVVVSTDYRPALKSADRSKLSSVEGFVASLQHAIFTAVEDFFDATHYITRHAKDWNVDTNLIVACGSSAGAITALQAEYELCNRTELTKRLPETFNYAGVVSFAGAICNLGALQWKEKPCPLMMFHGDADRTVPYEKAVIESLGGLWGSAHIVGQLNEMDTSYSFYKVENKGHVIADSPMQNNRYDVLSFLYNQVLNKKKQAIVTNECVPGETPSKKDFTLTDYIRENMN